MRIVFVLPNLSLNGGVKVVAIHARHLLDRGHEVIVVARRQRRPGLGRRLRDRLAGRPPAGRAGLNDDTHLAALGLDYRLIDRPGPIQAADLPDADIVVGTWWETMEWVSSLPPEKGVRFHFIQGYEMFAHLPLERVEAVYRLDVHRLAVSRWLVEVLRDRHGVAGCDLVGNAVDLTRFHAPARVKPAVPTFGFQFSNTASKNAGLAVASLIRARERVPELRVVAFGTGRPDTGFTGLDWVTYHQRPDQELIPALYASLTAWLHGSLAEGFGLPILEAMACGTPVIATPAGAAPDYVDRSTGALVEADADAFVREIARFAAMDEAAWRAVSDAALARVSGYTWDDAAGLMEAAFLRALGSDPDRLSGRAGAGRSAPART